MASERSAALAQDAGARTLADERRRAIGGEVRFGAGDRALYAADASNYRQVPIGVVCPRSVEDVVRTIEVARAHDAPVLSRGGGTSLAGQCCNTAVVIDFSKYVHGVLDVDVEGRRARVLPGTVLDVLRDATQPHGLTFGPDPATHTHCTLGGMIGNDSCGIHSVQAEFYGPGARTDDNLESLEILTYDGERMRVGPTSDEELERIIAAGGRRGEIYGRLRALRDRHATAIRERMPRILRRVSGYNLTALLPEHGFNVARALCGSEGTCVTILEATVTLVPSPGRRALLVLGYPTVFDAGDHVPEIRRFRPVGLEGMDDVLVEYMHKKHLREEHLDLLPEGRGWLLVEFADDEKHEAVELAQQAAEALRRSGNPPSMAIYDDEERQEHLWNIRESGLGATAFVPGDRDTWPGWEDSAVPVERIGPYLRDLRALMKRYDYDAALYGHFGQGCVHCRIDFDLHTPRGIEQYRAFTREAAELVVRHGGSLSGEHGDGQARGDLLSIMYGDELLDAFHEFKEIWDPRGRMNPGKVIDARSRTDDLRIGPEYRPADPPTHFAWPEDEESFAHATLRCVGVGKCRRLGGGTMCPSYMVLREEKHTTRGRAHLLFEMLRGDTITDGWQSEEVKESLDLCLSCKGCKSDCPVNVDIAKYKAEFLSHYFEAKRRPRSAYAFGLIDRWAALASLAPGLANFATQTPGLATIAKAAAGVAQERTLPRFAPRRFTSWFRSRGPNGNGGSRRVLLWPDTFNEHFHPDTLVAAVEVLEGAGWRVTIPRQRLCCGRPLYEFGMLDRAKARLRTILDALGPELEAGTPVVGLEPSCTAVFRDELPDLLPDDPRANRLRELTHTLGELLARDGHAPDWHLDRRALVHGHCHHKSVMGIDDEVAMLERLGLELEVLDSGCCGMAGSFGFEREKYDVSVAAGERVLLPAVRRAEPDTLIIADGFSCREQIEQGTHRRALHSAQVLQLAMRAPAALPVGATPEHAVARLAPRSLERPPIPPVAVAAIAGASLLGAGVLARRLQRRRREHERETAARE